MKTAYELAMERLNKSAPLKKLTAGQKKQIAELDAQYAAKIAGREIALQADLGKAEAGGDFEQYAKLQQQLVTERKALQTEWEEKKEQLRQGHA